MCGITGGISFTGEFFPSRDELQQSSDFLRLRGPDDEGKIFLDQGDAKVAFAHRRLSIIDLSANGRQPMRSASGQSWIVFNGEIYNYQTLRNELEKKHFSFNSRSDTEVILNAFECWGIAETLIRLDGMFAFALFDVKNNVLFLARDRFGKKPLYFFYNDRQLFFSSDIRSFEVINSIPREIDLHALGYLFSELSTPIEHTIWKHIKKLRPENYLAFGTSGLSLYQPYSHFRYTEECCMEREDILATTENLITQAVKKRLIGDVRVSALLSGGIDSSLVVAKMAEQTSGKIKTYSVGFNEDSFNELSFARTVAERFNTDHCEVMLTPDSLIDAAYLISEFGEPFCDVSMLPTYWISKEVAKTEKVVMGGDGGDELFGGYDSYYLARKYDIFKELGFLLPFANVLHKIHRSYRTELLVRILRQTRKAGHTMLDRNMSFDSFDLKCLFDEEAFFNAIESEHKFVWDTVTPASESALINVMQGSLKTRLVNDYLVKVDRATMCASLEMRTPFLDKDLASFASTLKPKQIFQKGRPKSILKDIAGQYFDAGFVNRNKMGFSVPLGEWFRGDVSKVMREVILGGKQNLVKLNYEFIESILESHCRGSVNHTHKLWTLFVFHIWASNR